MLVFLLLVFPFYNHQQCLHYRCPNMAVKEADEDDDIGEDIEDVENVVISKQLFSFFPDYLIGYHNHYEIITLSKVISKNALILLFDN